MGRSKLPRTQRAVKGWRWKTSRKPRTPLGFPSICGIALAMARSCESAMAAFTLAAFSSYGRPKETMGLRWKGLLPPVPGLSKFWTLVPCPSGLDVVPKMGDSDVAMDTKELQWMAPCFRVMCEGLALYCAWNFSCPEYVAVSRRAAKEASPSGAVPYQLRHSGAS